jgi:hypothetical protein
VACSSAAAAALLLRAQFVGAARPAGCRAIRGRWKQLGRNSAQGLARHVAMLHIPPQRFSRSLQLRARFLSPHQPTTSLLPRSSSIVVQQPLTAAVAMHLLATLFLWL